MAQLAIAAVGAAIGGAVAPGAVFLGLTGSAIGWSVGSVIGAMFTPGQNGAGPRLSDLTVTGATYGDTIPWIAGHPRIAGQLWWASERRELSETTEVGKGGGSEYTSYTYEVDVLIGLTDCQIGGVSRVWNNGKLVWTKLADSGTTSALSGKASTWVRRMSVYTGSATQLPDPTYEAAVGTGNAPAYRGRGSVFLEGLQLGSSGAMPNLTFEVYTEGDEEGRAAETLTTFPYSLGQDGGVAAMALPSFTHHVQRTSTESDVYQFTLGLEEVELLSTYTTVSSSGNPRNMNSDVSGQFLMNVSNLSCYWYGDDGVGILFTLPYNINTGSLHVVFCRAGSYVFIGSQNETVGDERIYRYSTSGGTATVTGAVLPGGALSIAYSDGLVYVLDSDGLGSSPSAVWVLDEDTLTLQETLGVPPGTDEDSQLVSDENGRVYCYSSTTLYVLSGSSWVAAKSVTGGMTYGQQGNRLSVYGGDFWAIAIPGGGSDARLRVVFDSVELTEPTIQEVVEDLCERAGMSAGTYDATALSTITTPVRGMYLSQVAPIRAVMEQLASAYFFECYVADKLYFIPRGGSVALAVDTDDMGAGEDQPADEVLPISITADAEIPAQIALTYANADADYNSATEHSDRILSGQASTATVALPMSFTASEAKGICDAMVLDGYASRIGGQVSLPLAYTRLVPTDIVTLTGQDGTIYRARLVRREDSGSVLRFEWVLDDASSLESAGITSDDYTPSLDVALPGPTSLALMDIPILRDADDAPGIYAAGKPLTTVWPGANLYSSVNSADYTQVAVFGSRAVFGTATTTLGNWTGGNVFDEGSTLTVNVGEGTLSSATREAMLNSDANALLVGSEIIQFRTATFVSTGVYTLSGLLRGRRGTEWASTGHAADETVVLLQTAGLARVSYDAARIGIAASYKAVTLGKSLDSAVARSITDTGVALKPFAPVDLRCARAASGTYTLTWSRRTRLAYRWPSTAPALGEESEAYVVRIYADGTYATVEREIEVAAASATYTFAQQETDFGSGQNTIYVGVTQVSETVGEGYELRASLTANVGTPFSRDELDSDIDVRLSWGDWFLVTCHGDAGGSRVLGFYEFEAGDATMTLIDAVSANAATPYLFDTELSAVDPSTGQWVMYLRAYTNPSALRKIVRGQFGSGAVSVVTPAFDLSTNPPYGLTYSDGKFIALCIDGTVYHSTDGETWDSAGTVSGTGAPTGPAASSFDTARFIEVGTNLVMLYANEAAFNAAQDGLTWTAATGDIASLPTGTYTEKIALYQIGIAGGQAAIIGVGKATASSNVYGLVYGSTDGEAWTLDAEEIVSAPAIGSKTSSATDSAGLFAFGGNLYGDLWRTVGGSTSNSIVEFFDFGSVAISYPGRFSLAAAGTTAVASFGNGTTGFDRYQIYTTDDFLTWANVAWPE